MTETVLAILGVLIILWAFKDFKKALILFTVLLPFAAYFPAFELKGVNIQTIIIVVLFFASARLTGRMFPPSLLNTCLLILLTVTLASWAVTSLFPPPPPQYPYQPRWEAFTELSDIKRWIIFIPVYFIFVNATYRADDKTIRALLIAILVGVGLEALNVLKEFLVTHRVRVYGSLGNPNELGAFFAAYMPLVAIFFIDARELIRRIFYGGIGFFSLFGLVYSQSRGSYVAFLGTVAVFAYIRARILIVVMLVMFAVTITAGYDWLPDVVVKRINFTFEPEYFNENFQGVAGEFEESAASRLILAQGALRVFSESPVWGRGIGTLEFIIGSYMGDLGYNKNKVAHNMYLQILAELGLLGFLPFIWIFIVSGRSAHRLFRTGESPLDRNIGIAFFCCVAAMSISNLFGNRFFSLTLTGYYWVMAAIVFNKLRQARLPKEAISENPMRDSGALRSEAFSQ
jgi:O-antigen ligase